MDWIAEALLLFLGLGGLLLLVSAFLSPFEALGWWAGWTRRQLEPEASASEEAADESTASYYIVYLAGAGAVSPEELSGREKRFLGMLGDRLSGALIVSDVFPYSVSNNPLTGERLLSWMWSRLHWLRKEAGIGLANPIFLLRNVFQVAVSADRRYGPIYNVGVAQEIARSLLRHGYPAGSGKTVFLVGWSGGGQVMVGAAPYLQKALGAPISIVSIGGVISDDPGIAEVDHLYHINASKDYVTWQGAVYFPGRWPILRHSEWNKAKRGGRITFINPGPMKHWGRGDYFDRRATLPNGQSHVDKTVELAAEIISNHKSG